MIKLEALAILDGTRTAIEKVLDTAKLERKREELDECLQGTFVRIRVLIGKNACEAMEQDTFLTEHKALSDRCAAPLAEIEKVDKHISICAGARLLSTNTWRHSNRPSACDRVQPQTLEHDRRDIDGLRRQKASVPVEGWDLV